MPLPASGTVFRLVVLALLSGCASLDKDECLHANWYAIGLEDGAAGRAIERLGEHRRSCAKHAVAPDTDRYLAGRSEGLKSFCTPARGYTLGRSGQAYRGVCPDDRAGALTREAEQLEQRIANLERN